MAGFLGSGDLYGDRLDDAGVSTGFVLLGNAKKFAITEETETKERISTGKTTYGQALDTASIKKPAKIAILLDNFDKDTLAMALLGDAVTLNQGAATTQTETITAKAGKFIQLALGNLASANFKVEANDGVVASARVDSTAYAVGDFIIPAAANDHYYKCTVAGTSDAAPPTYPVDGTTVVDGTATWLDMGTIILVKDTDYTVNYAIGMVESMATGVITDGQSLKVTYDANAIAGYTISGSTKPTIKMVLKLDGKNQASGKDVIVSVDEAVLTPSSEVDFQADDFISLELGGTLKTLTGQTSPYSVELRN